MRRISSHAAFLLAGFGLLWPGTSSAQDAARTDSVRTEGESYGAGTNYTLIQQTEFTGDGFTVGNEVGYRLIVTEVADAVAGAPLPAGAQVLDVCAFTRLEDSGGTIELDWEAVEMVGAAPPGVGPVRKIFGSVSTSEATPNGYGFLCMGRKSETLVRKFQDLDGDGRSGYVKYLVRMHFEGNPGSLGFGGALIKWQRTISPAPAVATFGDVSTSYVYFKAIQALAASGIASGCGNGNFCPNQNVTRGEMAAFLARALGLHWPL